MADKIVFDENSNIRVLDPEKYNEAKQLKEKCSEFLDSRAIIFG